MFLNNILSDESRVEILKFVGPDPCTEQTLQLFARIVDLNVFVQIFVYLKILHLRFYCSPISSTDHSKR